ncbi:MAG: hypothetical protein MI785_27520 [Kiloniellales bacterium]|nr:hypothetical protein [Kiloniellales bacterium]
MQAPLVDELLGELGFEPRAGLNGLADSLSRQVKDAGAAPNGGDPSSTAKSRGGPEDSQPRA